MNRSQTFPRPHIVIVGGGLAGLAASSALVDRGLRITLLESRPRLGGRASSFVDPATGEQVDNCQHVSLACCTNLADFSRRVGIDFLFRREPAVVFLGPNGAVWRLQAGLFPPPFHLAWSFLGARFLSWAEKLQVGRALARLALDRDEQAGESFADWLLRHGQSLRAINLFWAPVLVSALNERLERMDIGHARKVVVDGFLKTRHGFEMEVPLVPLGELYGTRLEAWLRRKQVELRMGSAVRSIELDDDGALAGVALRQGERISADFVILAVSFDRAAELLPAVLRRDVRFAGVSTLEASPITGVHLWFDRPVCPYAHVVTPGRLVQWVFNHTALQGRQAPAGFSHPDDGTPVGSSPRKSGRLAGSAGGQYLQVVISASYDLLHLDREAIRAAVVADLAELWPAATEARLLRSWVVTEHGATFAVRPGVDALRPPQRTSVDGLFLAGDWTATGWPATMEGAVRSGYLAAEGVLQDLDRPSRLIQPELRPGRLAGWLLGKHPIQLAAPVAWDRSPPPEVAPSPASLTVRGDASALSPTPGLPDPG